MGKLFPWGNKGRLGNCRLCQAWGGIQKIPPNSPEETRLVTKRKVPKSVPRTVDGEPAGLVKGPWESERVAHEDVCHWYPESCLPGEHLTPWGMENHRGLSPNLEAGDSPRNLEDLSSLVQQRQ